MWLFRYFRFFRFGIFGIDDAIVGAGISAAGAIGGSLIGAHSAREANQANVEAARETMKFQERMRDTSYQAAVKDLAAAGLNPMLAYGNGGAAVPTGATPVHRPTMDGATLVNGALSAARLFNESKQVDATVENIKADTAVKLEQAKQVLQDAYLKAAQRTTESYRPQLVVDQAKKFNSESHSINMLLQDTLENLRARTVREFSTARQIESQNVLMKDVMANPITRPFAPLLNLIFK